MGFNKIIYNKGFSIIGYLIQIEKPTMESSTFKNGKILSEDLIHEQI